MGRVTVAASEDEEQVEKTLRDYKRKANVPGFRPGMVPMGLINKMYRKGVVAEQAYKLASNGCFEYLEKEKIDFVGDVLPSDDQKELDFDAEKEFEFIFEVGIAPKVDINLSDKDKLTYHKIKADKEMLENYRSNYLRRFGRLVDVEKVDNDEALSCTLDNGDLKVEDAYVDLRTMDEEERKPVKGKKSCDKMKINVNELVKNKRQRAAILGVKEEELAELNPEFDMEITKIRKFADPEMNAEFFASAFPAGNVTDEKGLDTYVAEQIQVELDRESSYLLSTQIRDYVVNKADLKLPETFLKRWLHVINEGKFTMEEIEKDFDGFLKMYTWNLIQKHYVKELGLEVSADEALTEAKALAAMQFAQYGMPSAPENMLEEYGKRIMSNKQEAQKVYEKLYETKVVDALKAKVKISEKSVSVEEFGKIAQGDNAEEAKPAKKATKKSTKKEE